MVFESFGFKYGVPHDADFIFDTRFLPNPYWIPELRPYSGLDQPVIDYLGAQEEVSAYINQIFTFLRNWLPMIERSSRSYLTVALDAQEATTAQCIPPSSSRRDSGTTTR